MKSTPLTPERIIWATALPPAPPTPTTLITVPLALLSSISKFIMIDSLTFPKNDKYKNFPSTACSEIASKKMPVQLLAPNLKLLPRIGKFFTCPIQATAGLNS
jgi:hypothetical protein